MNKKDILSIAGFLLFIFGFLALILSMIGLKLVPLLWLDSFGALGSFVMKIVMIMAGIIMIIMTRSGESGPHDDFFAEEE